MIIKGMASNQKGMWPIICKLGSHDLPLEGSAVVKNRPLFMKNTPIYTNHAFRDLSCEIIKFQLSLEIKPLIFDWLKLGYTTSLKKKSISE